RFTLDRGGGVLRLIRAGTQVGDAVTLGGQRAERQVNRGDRLFVLSQLGGDGFGAGGVGAVLIAARRTLRAQVFQQRNFLRFIERLAAQRAGRFGGFQIVNARLNLLHLGEQRVVGDAQRGHLFFQRAYRLA